MQTPENTERYLVAARGSKMAIRFHELRVFDTLPDAVEYGQDMIDSGKGWPRVFLASPTKRMKEVDVTFIRRPRVAPIL